MKERERLTGDLKTLQDIARQLMEQRRLTSLGKCEPLNIEITELGDGKFELKEGGVTETGDYETIYNYLRHELELL